MAARMQQIQSRIDAVSRVPRRTLGGGNPDEIINLLNQLKLSVVRSGQELLTPAEYRAIGADMYTRGIQPNGFPDGFL